MLDAPTQFSLNDLAEGYRNTFTALPYRVPLRAERRTPRPRIHGVMHARIDGVPDSVSAPLDEQGRYKVLLPFDLDPDAEVENQSFGRAGGGGPKAQEIDR